MSTSRSRPMQVAAGTRIAPEGSGPPDSAIPKILNLSEAARLVRCSRAHLSNIIHGKVFGLPVIPAIRIGRRVLFRRESLERWLQDVEATGVRRTAS